MSDKKIHLESEAHGRSDTLCGITSGWRETRTTDAPDSVTCKSCLRRISPDEELPPDDDPHLEIAYQGVDGLVEAGDMEGVRRVIRYCLRELEEEREALDFITEMFGVDSITTPASRDRVERLRSLLPETEGEA